MRSRRRRQGQEEEVGDDGDRDGARACDAGVGRGARCPRPPANVRFLCICLVAFWHERNRH